MTVIFDCSRIQSEQDFHMQIAHALCFQGHYGMNFDAFYDAISDCTHPLCLKLLHFEDMADYCRISIIKSILERVRQEQKMFSFELI